MRELSISAFETAIDQCVEEKVDFVLIARDLLHMNLPELSDVARAATKLNQVKEAGIRTYVVYGSHDYSAATVSIGATVKGSNVCIRSNTDNHGASFKRYYLMEGGGFLFLVMLQD